MAFSQTDFESFYRLISGISGHMVKNKEKQLGLFVLPWQLYRLRGLLVIFYKIFSQKFYLIQLLQTTHPIEFLDS